METTDLKALWQSIPTSTKKNEQLLGMLKESNQPVLKDIKKQLLLESIGLFLFLICFYTMFDAEQKPLWVNILLTLAISAPIVHNIKGYLMYQEKIEITNLKSSLNSYLIKLNNYVIQVLICRIIFATSIVFFFTYNLNLTPQKWLIVGMIALTFGIQMWFLYRIWIKRINRIKSNIKALDDI